MEKGDIEYSMYQMAIRYCRPPVMIVPIKREADVFAAAQEVDCYLLKDDIEQPLGLLKVFETDNEEEEKKVVRSIEGMKLISSLGLMNSVPAIPIDFEQAAVESRWKMFVALFNIPEGKSLLTHIKYLSKQKEYSLERKQAFDILRDGYIKLAAAFAELHSRRYSPLCTISEFYWNSHMDVCEKLVKTLRAFQDSIPFDLNDFADKLIRMAAGAYTKPCSAAFLHGDPQPASLIYEPFSGTFSMMDMEEAYHSIDERGNPCGPSAYDFVWGECAFELHMTIISAPRDELYDILSDYRQTYKTAMRERFPAAHHLTFYSVLFWLPIYKRYVAHFEGDLEAMTEGDQRIYELALKRVQAVLSYAG